VGGCGNGRATPALPDAANEQASALATQATNV